VEANPRCQKRPRQIQKIEQPECVNVAVEATDTADMEPVLRDQRQ
jgi:hypothetical protein